MPRVANILRRPEVSSVTPLPADAPGASRVLVRVDGLACERICVRRAAAALRELPGVVDVRFSPDPDRFTVETNGPPPREEAMARAVRSVVVAPWARRLIAALAERLGLVPRRASRS